MRSIHVWCPGRRDVPRWRAALAIIHLEAEPETPVHNRARKRGTRQGRQDGVSQPLRGNCMRTFRDRAVQIDAIAVRFQVQSGLDKFCCQSRLANSHISEMYVFIKNQTRLR